MKRNGMRSPWAILRRAVFSAVLVVGASVASAGLEVTKTILNGLTTVPSGQTFTYKLQYRAASTTTDFLGATLTDVLPPGIEYQSLVGTVHVASFTYTAATRTLKVVFVDPLPAGSTGEILVNARFPQGATLPGTVATNTATLTAANAPPATSPPVTIAATAANRATATKSLTGSVPLDQNVTYTVSANNGQTVGALNATDVTLLDYLPNGAVFVAASGGGVYDANAHTVTWMAAALAAGSTLSRTLTLMYPSSAFALGTVATNNLTVTLTPLGGDPATLTARTVNAIVAPVASASFAKDVNANYVYEGKAASKAWTFSLQNTGNVPLDNVVLTDVIPAQVQVTSINSGLPSGTPAGLNDPISVYYTTTLNGTWTATPGSPYPGSALVTVTVSSLGLAPGEFITGLKWDFGTLPVGYKINSLQFGSTILTTGWDGQPVVAGQTILNTGVLAYTDFTGPKTKTDPASILVKSPRPVAELAKSASPSTVNDGSLTTFTIRLTNRSEAAQPLLNPVLADLLDGKLVYEPGSWTVVSKPVGAPDPLFETINNYIGNRTLLRWSWEGAASYSLPINSTIEMRFQARVPAGTIYGSINNDLTLAKWGNADLDTSGATATADTFDLDSDGNSTETVHYKRATLTVTARASMDSVKWVRGELDADWSKYPGSGQTVPGGRADYRLIVSNTGNVPIRNASILDILPTLDDTGVIDLSSRDTEWKAALAGPVVAPPGVTVYYSREQDPTRLDFDPAGPPGSDPANWNTTPPATLIEARALKFVFTDIVIQPGASFELTWPMRAPVATPTDGRVAWNSFGYTGTRTDSSTLLLPSEPIKVGIVVKPDTNAAYGDRVWYDINKDGQQDVGETGVNGIRVRLYEDSGVGGFADGVINTNVDRYVGFTITADDFNGQPGYYLFPNLDRGNYYAVFDIPSGYEVSPKNAGTDAALDSDVEALTGYTPITWLDDAEKDLTWDLGLFLQPTFGVSLVKTAGAASDGDILWTLPGTPVTYTYRVTNTGELAIVRMTVTDDKLGLIGTIDGPLAPGASATLTKTSSAIYTVVTNIGSVVGHPASPDGNEIPGAPPVRDDDDAIVWVYASIGDTVWYDVNRNGIQDAGEVGVGGVQVVLYDGAGVPVASTTTAANGRYRFNGLLPGDYSLGFTAPAGYRISPPNQGSNDAKDSDADPLTGRTATTTLVAGEYDPSWDLGIYQPVSLGDRVWLDVNRNGIQDAGEVGLVGVTVTLYNASGSPIGSTVTDAAGNYLFDDLPAGTYSVGFTAPVGYALTAANQGDDALDSDADLTTGMTATTTLLPGQSDLTLDAGMYRLVADLELTKTATRDCFPPKWTIPISKGEQFVVGDYWLRIEDGQPTFDVWGPGSIYAGVNIGRTWQHVAGRFTRGAAAWGPHKLEILVNGVVVATTSEWGDTDGSAASLFLGSYLGTHYFYAGAMDEVRLSGTARSDAWMKTSYAQQHSPATFLVAGAEVAGSIYDYQKSLTVQGAAVAGALTDFPVLVNVVDADLAAHVKTTEGWDIGFTLTDGTPLAHEVEKYYASSGTLIAWVKLPSLPAGADTTFVMHYGDATVAAATETPTDVWDADFRMVHHFEEPTGPVRDSTANGNDGIVTGAAATAAGSAGGAYLFDGVDDKIEIPDSPSVRFVNTDFTLEGWYARELPRNEFVITVTNRGPDRATSVTVADHLGTTMGYVTSDASQGVYDPVTGIWTIGTMDSNAVVRLVLVVDPLAASVTNRAEVASSDAVDPDSTPGNGVEGEDDQAQASTAGCSAAGLPAGPPVTPVPDRPALHVVQVAGGAPDGTVLTVASGSDVTYTYTVLNIGNVSLTNIVVTDDKLGAIGVVPTLLIGQSAVLTAVAVNVTAGVTNVATVTGDYGALQVNDTDTAVVLLAGSGNPGAGANPWDHADFAVTHQEFIGPAPTVTNEAFSVRVTVKNNGTMAGDAGKLAVFVSHFDQVVVGETGQATVDIGVLQAGETRTVEVHGLRAASTRGTHHVRAYIDIEGLATEWSLGDNQLSMICQLNAITMQVGLPPSNSGGGLVLTWNSFWGEKYIVYRTTSLSSPFEPLAVGIVATPPTNTFTDPDPPAGSAFYKIGVQP